jgi:hypothetical protein
MHHTCAEIDVFSPNQAKRQFYWLRMTLGTAPKILIPPS